MALTAAALAPTGIAAEDCNGNGIDDAEDIAAGRSCDTDGDGRPDECPLAAPVFLSVRPVPLEGRIQDTAFDDLDGDGLLDAVVAREDDPSMAVLPGGGGVAMDTARSFSGRPEPWDLVLEDLDGDGRIDAATTGLDGPGRFTLHRGGGDGTFGAPEPQGSGKGGFALATADFDGDGRLDVVVGGDALHVLFSRPEGGFGEGMPLANRSEVRSVVAADLEADGDQDLVTANRVSSDLSVFRGRGDGSFEAPVHLDIGGEPWQLGLADLDEDGRGDLVALIEPPGQERGPTHIAVRGAMPGGGWAMPVLTGLGGTVRGFRLADLDGDGHVDLTTGPVLLRGQGDGTWRAPQALPGIGGIAAIRDIDRDGHPDLITASSGLDGGLGIALQLPGDVARLIPDCDADGVPDACQIARDPSRDADENGVLDRCEAFEPPPPDCDGDGVPDAQELASGNAEDCDGNGVPDGCQLAAPSPGFSFSTAPATQLPGASQIEVTDFDLDGLPDLAFADERERAVGVAFGRGDGTFEMAGVTFPQRRTPSFLMTTDVDKDGAPDILFAPHGEFADLGLLLGRGDGTFDDVSPVGLEGSVRDVVPVDLDGDGALDLAATGTFTPRTPGGVAVVRGTGGGSFTEFRDIVLDDSPHGIATGDVNGDGQADVVVTGVGSVTLLIGTGDGWFEGPSEFGAPARAVDLLVRDVDGDGLDDVRVWGFANEPVAGLLRSRGEGLLPVAGVAAGLPPLSLPPGQRDGDALAVRTFQSRALVWHTWRGGTLGTPQEWMLGRGVRDVALADTDDDGAQDLIGLERNTGNLLIGRGRGDGTFDTAHRILVPAEDSREGGTPVAIDIDSDGRRDLVRLERDGRVIAARRNLGGFRFGAPEKTPVGLELDRYSLQAADIDGDGQADLIGRSYDAILILRVPGDGTIVPGEPFVPEFPFEEALRFDVQDVDRDGRADLLFVRLPPDVPPRDTLLVARGRGDGTFVDPAGLLVDGVPTALAVADVDRDGLPDIVTGEDPNRLTVFAGLGEGRFSRLWSGPVPGVDEGFEPRDMAATDFDGDGDLDLAWIERSRQRVTWLAGAGDGSFTEGGSWPLDSQPNALATLELDGDGRHDLVAGIPETGSLEVFTTRGTPGFGLAGTIPVPRLRRLFASDLDADGREDLIVTSEDPNDEPLVLGLPNRSVLRDPDCDGDGRVDACRILSGESPDRNENLVPDECEPDCDGNGIPDDLDIASGDLADCDRNGVPDRCDIREGSAGDIDEDGVPDRCQPDCDGDGVPDGHAVASGAAPDCDRNGIPDACDMESGRSPDRNGDGVPDACQEDCDGDGVPDLTEIASGIVSDCDGDGVPDPCQIAADLDLDLDGDGVLDRCEPDCNGNGIPDDLDIASTMASDCDENGVPDSCDLETGSAADCDRNGVPDACDLARGEDVDSDGNGVLDACEGGARIPGDCNQDGALDMSDALCVLDALFAGGPEGLPCGDGKPQGLGNRRLLDWQPDGRVDLSDAISNLQFLFLGGPGHAGWPGGEPACRPVFGCDEAAGCP